jgi:antitoxin ParD1/3/4
MTTMNISLPDDMKAFVEAEAKSNGYMSASEYIRNLIREQKEIADFRAMVQEGLDSEAMPLDDGFFDVLRQRVRDHG